jgi:hypothetical protein
MYTPIVLTKITRCITILKDRMQLIYFLKN